jgi:O-antigen ligase
MSLIWATLATLALILAVFSIVDIVRRRLGTGPTVAWVLLVVILPFVGSVVYWALRKPEPEDVQRIADAERAREDEARRRSVDSTGLGR